MVPLLFTEAYHATIDVPTAVGNAQQETGVVLRLAGILGMGEEVLLAMEDSAAGPHRGARGDPAVRRRLEPHGFDVETQLAPEVNGVTLTSFAMRKNLRPGGYGGPMKVKRPPAPRLQSLGR